MASPVDPAKGLSQLIDEIEEIRERLLGIQRNLEKIERADLKLTGDWPQPVSERPPDADGSEGAAPGGTE